VYSPSHVCVRALAQSRPAAANVSIHASSSTTRTIHWPPQNETQGQSLDTSLTWAKESVSQSACPWLQNPERLRHPTHHSSALPCHACHSHKHGIHPCGWSTSLPHVRSCVCECNACVCRSFMYVTSHDTPKRKSHRLMDKTPTHTQHKSRTHRHTLTHTEGHAAKQTRLG